MDNSQAGAQVVPCDNALASYREKILPRRALALVLLALIFAAGCNTRPYITPERLERGKVIILPGIEGPSLLNASIRKGLFKGDIHYALEIYNWHKHRLGASYAFNQTASRQRARELAHYVADYRAAHPARPVFIVGHSGGAAIAVFTAEATEPSHPLDGLIILAPPLSPEYDLTTALAGSSRNIVACSAANDLFLRSLTTIGRNFDGTSGATAGQDGFVLPPSASLTRRRAFEDLRQVRWHKSMRPEGNWGGHRGWASSRWVAATLAPIIKQWARPAKTNPAP